MNTFSKIILAAIVVSLFSFSACSSAKNSSAMFRENIEKRVWQLELVETTGENSKVVFDSLILDPEKFADIYTITFDGQRAFGKAAPNRFNAAYKLGEDFAITFGPAAGTMMAGVFVPEGLNEYEFYKLLENVSSWKYDNGQFSLQSGDKIMTFGEINITED